METQFIENTLYNKRADAIIAVMTTCTNQIEDYEKRNFGECMTCAGFFTATFAAIGAVLLIGPTAAEATEEYMSNIFLATACMLMLIPAVVTIFLYDFAMNCRRSAILRGYMQFLEERLNGILCETSMLYHGALFSDEIDLFPVNRYGPVALGFALIALFAACCVWSWSLFSYAKPTPYEFGYYFFFGAVLVICVPCSIFYSIALTRNGKAVDRAKDMCDKLYADYSINSDKLPTLAQLKQIAKEYNAEKLKKHQGLGTSKYIRSKL